MHKLLVSLAVLIALGSLPAYADPQVFMAKMTWHPAGDSDQPDTSHAVFVTAWFDAYKERMRGRFTADDLFFDNVTDSPYLACAPAGQGGPQVVDSYHGSVDSSYVSDTVAHLAPKIAPESVSHYFKSSPCGMVIDNIASVEAAARARRLFVVIPTTAGRLRGQLWPAELLSTNARGHRRFLAEAKMSGEQAQPRSAQITPRLTVKLSFNEGLGSAWYSVPNYGTLPEALSVGLHCAPAGERGPLIATLLASSGKLTAADITPVSGDEICGVPINNLASVLEALLQGRLYAVLYTATNSYWGEQRGQFEHIVRNDDF